MVAKKEGTGGRFVIYHYKKTKFIPKASKQGAENKNKTHQIINKHMPAEPVKSIIGKAIRKEWQNKWNNAPHYITRNYFIRVQTKTEPSVYLISPGHT